MSWRHVTHSHVTDYISYLLDTTDLSPSTIRTRISAVAYFYKSRLNVNPTQSFGTDILLKHLDKTSSAKRRLPINKVLLDQLLLTVYQRESKFLSHAFYLMYFFLYMFALRISELLDYSKTFQHALRVQDVSLKNNVLSVRVRSGKHNSSSMTYTVPCFPRLFWNFTQFLRLRGNRAGPFFCFKNRRPISRSFFANSFKQDLCSLGVAPARYNTHSFRIGRTTDLALSGASDRQIALVGRWRSDAFREYIGPRMVAL